MTPDEAYTIFVEAIQHAKAQGIEIVGGVYGIEADAGGVYHVENHGRKEVCPVGAVILHGRQNGNDTLGILDMMCLLGMTKPQVLQIVAGVDGTQEILLHHEWYALGARLRTEFKIQYVYIAHLE